MDELLELLTKFDDLTASRICKVSRPTIDRWRRGVSEPHPLALEAILNALKKAKPEQEKLAELYKKLGIVNTHASWGPEGLKMSDEQKAAYLHKVTLEVEEDLANTVSIPVSQLVDIADSLRALNELSRASVDEWMAMPKEMSELKQKIGQLVNMTHMFAEQWLPQDLQTKRRMVRLNTD